MLSAGVRCESSKSTGFLFGWLFYLPLFLIGFPLAVLATVNAINLIYQFWVHTRHIGRLGPLDYILVTPSNHRVHHARNERYLDRNYGGMFILWDRWFGTFEDESADEPVVYGTRKPLNSWDPVWANLQVYEGLWFDARHTERWQDKLKVWFSRTGWRPMDVRERYPDRSETGDLAIRFDPATPRGLSRYALGQFIVAVGLTLAIAQGFALWGAAAVLIPCVFLWMQLWTIGALNEGRPEAVRYERLRLVVVGPTLLALALWSGLPLGAPGVIGVLAYLALSLAALSIASRPGKIAINTESNAISLR